MGIGDPGKCSTVMVHLESLNIGLFSLFFLVDWLKGILNPLKTCYFAILHVAA